MPESSQPPHPPVSTVARMLATVALLHGSHLDNSPLDSSRPHDSRLDDRRRHDSGLDHLTATALVDAIAYLTSSGDTDGADALLRLVTTDEETIAATHVALHTPARRPHSDTAPTCEPLPPLPRRVPGPYRDPGQPTTPGGRRSATTSEPTPWPAGTGESGGGRTPLSETRRWREATAAQVLLLDYAVTGAAGRLTGVYTPVPIVHPPGWCDHLDTICGGCLAGWSEDHCVAVFRHGIDGAATGCRCPVCRTTIPTRPAPPDRRPDGDRDPDGPTPARPTPGDPDGGGTTTRDPGWFGEGGS